MSTVPGRRFVALRWLLLVLMALGVAGMHTLGHPGGGDGAHPPVVEPAVHGSAGHGAVTAGMSAGMTAGMSAGMTAGMSAGMTAGMELPPAHPGGGLDPSAVCLAVLTAVGLTVLAVAGTLLSAGRTAGGRHPGRAVLAILGRAPPPPRGLAIAGLSVQRM